MSRLGRKLYPELSLLPEAEHRAALFRQAQRGLFRSPWAWTIALPVTATVAWLLSLGKGVVQDNTALPSAVLHAGLVAALCVYVFVVSTFIFVKPMRRAIREALCRRGIPVCLGCGFDIRAQTEPRCPECGVAFDASLLDRGRDAMAARD